MNGHRADITEQSLNAWVDGRLPADERARIDAAIAADAGLRAHAAHLQQQNLGLRELFDRELAEPVPAELSAAALGQARADRRAGAGLRTDGRAAANHPWFRRVAGLLAAGAIGLVLGWLARGALPDGAPVVASARPPAADTGPSHAGVPLTRAAAVAHAAYVPEVRHPVEVGAGEQAHLVAWLSKRLGTSLRVPDLGAHGFTLVGGRLLPDDSGGVAALFMFENPSGTRLTLFVRRDATGGDTAFHFAEQGRIGTFHWLDRGFGYALSGELSRDAMLSVATAVYQQLNP